MSATHAVVVGGSRGLGLVVVERFLARGCTVTVLSRSPSDRHAGDDRVRHVVIDLEAPDGVDGVWDRVIADAGPINYLVLCQRFRGEGDPWSGEIQVGLNASRALIEGFKDHFVSAGDRAIGVVSSVYAEFTGSSQPVGYHVVKAGLNGMVRFYAGTLGRRGIRVNAIMPLSYIKDEARAFYQSKTDLLAVYDEFVPLRRMGEADDSANALDFLCSDKAAFINGQSLFIDGGASVVWSEEVAKRFKGL
jgi:NAD(P)-dependent dehydrogenase (short-subunit alcohol dehydrogenase family)